MNSIVSMLSDGEGNVSSMRSVMLMFVLYILAAHIALLVKTGALPPFTSDELSLLGLMWGAKLVQNSQETKTPTQTGESKKS